MSHPRRRLDILKELLALTKKMASKRSDADFLLASVLRRQALMLEYDQVKVGLPPLSPSESDEALHIAQEIMTLDKIINATLEGHRNETMAELKKHNPSQKLLGYQQAQPASGNHFDLRK